jgi:flavonol synthase
MPQQPIPVVDLDVASRSTAPAHLLEKIKAATEGIGVIQVVNHGVRPGLLDDFSLRVARLLSLPRVKKAELASPVGHPYRGWRQWPDDFGRLELERFNVGQFDNAAHARASGLAEEYVGLYKHENVWPADDPRLQAVTHQYLNAARRVAERVLGVYARAQGLPGDTFALGDLPYVTLTVSDYPTWTYPERGNDEDKLLALERADDSAITILTQAGDHEGLQVQRADGTWISVPAVPGALLAFSGTILTRWTNGRLCSASHRVVAGGAGTRRSTGVFMYPALDRVLEPLAPFTEPGVETGYESVATWDLVKGETSAGR